MHQIDANYLRGEDLPIPAAVILRNLADEADAFAVRVKDTFEMHNLHEAMLNTASTARMLHAAADEYDKRETPQIFMTMRGKPKEETPEKPLHLAGKGSYRFLTKFTRRGTSDEDRAAANDRRKRIISRAKRAEEQDLLSDSGDERMCRFYRSVHLERLQREHAKAQAKAQAALETPGVHCPWCEICQQKVRHKHASQCPGCRRMICLRRCMLESRRHIMRLCIDCAGNESFDSWSQSSDSTGSEIDAIAAETGGGGGLHWHGLSYGYNNPQMGVGSEQLARDVGPVYSVGECDAG